MSIGFIILRHVNNSITNNYWIHSYDCIRKLYPENNILIIDDNSNYEFITNKDLYKTNIINSEFPKRGELLPYYYYLKNKLFDIAVILHDSVFINEYIDFNVDTYKIIWNFTTCQNENIQDVTNLLKLFDDDNLLNFYYRYDLWRGCFGGMSIITHNYLSEFNSKYDLSKLLEGITTRYNRCSFEIVLGCLLYKYGSNNKNNVLLGDIDNYLKSYNIKWAETEWNNKDNYNHLPLLKIWTGR
jgi:hypothetical protein